MDESISRGRGSIEGSQQDNTQQGASESSNSKPFSSSGSKVAVFGFECDSALHLAIKQHATEAAMNLIQAGACINFSNAKVSFILDENCSCVFCHIQIAHHCLHYSLSVPGDNTSDGSEPRRDIGSRSGIIE